MFYDYKCDNCNHVQEENHPMSGPKEKIVCEKCGGSMKKMISAPAVVFKGEGWMTNELRDK